MSLNKRQKLQSIAAIGSLAAIALAIFATSSSKAVKVPYSEFVDNVNSATVQSVMIEDDEVRYSLFGENKSYVTRYLSDSSLLETLDKSNIEYTILPSKKGPDWSIVVYIMSGLLMTGIITSVVTSSSSNDNLSSNKADSNSKNKGKKIIVDKKSKISFADIGGNEQAKESLKEIIDFLENPQKYTQMGAKLPKGTLLIGPPGTGKTLLAKAVAGEANVPFIYMAGSDFVEMYIGLGAAKVRRLFEIAEKNAPCIVFIDEIDAIGKKRDPMAVGSGSDEREQTLNQLLSEMDGFNSSKGVVVLAATNRPEALDEAITRPGRFDRRIIIERPDARSRKSIIKSYLSKIKVDKNIDIDQLVYCTAGCTGADLANIVNEAAIKAVREGKELVTNDELQEAMEHILSGSCNHSVALTEIEKCIIATHEAAHTIASIALDTESAVNKVSIIPRNNTSLGYTLNYSNNERHVAFKDEMLNQIRILLSGYCGEFVLLNNVSSAANDDIKEATNLIREMIMTYGMSTEFGPTSLENGYNDLSDQMKFCIDKKVIEIIKHCYTETIDFIQANADILQDLATELVQKESLTYNEIKEILNGKTIKVPKFNNFKESPTLLYTPPQPEATIVQPSSNSKIENNDSNNENKSSGHNDKQKKEQPKNPTNTKKETSNTITNGQISNKDILKETIEIDDSDLASMNIEMNIPDIDSSSVIDNINTDFDEDLSEEITDNNDLPDKPTPIKSKADGKKKSTVNNSQKERDSKILNDILNTGIKKKNKLNTNEKPKNENTSKELTEDDY